MWVLLILVLLQMAVLATEDARRGDVLPETLRWVFST